MDEESEEPFPQRYKQTAKRMKRCSTPLVFREVQIKSIMRYHFTSTRKTMIKTIMITNNNDNFCGKVGTLTHTLRNVQWCSQFRKKLWQFLKRSKQPGTKSHILHNSMKMK